MNDTQTLLLTPGEPSGIGPDIVLDIAQLEWKTKLVVIADPELLKTRATLLNLSITIIEIQSLNETIKTHTKKTLYVLPVKLTSNVICGTLNKDNSDYVVRCLSLAEKLCSSNRCDALITGPVHKGIINQAGINFTGHTEFLASPTNSKPVMMLATQSLRVALATTHLPLRDVSQAITQDLLIDVISTLNDFLINNCNIRTPQICVCGLNPHAGEDGHLGTEEIDTITPAINHCLDKNIKLSPAMPADTAFTQHNLKKYDAILAMYHDQGLPVLKHQGFGQAVNITLGLPFIRTSVDHGTAIDLAGTGKANSTSLVSAINMAIELSGSNI